MPALCVCFADYVHNVLQEDNEEEAAPQKASPNDDWDDGLTFTAKSTREYLSECSINILRLKTLASEIPNTRVSGNAPLTIQNRLQY